MQNSKSLTYRVYSTGHAQMQNFTNDILLSSVVNYYKENQIINPQTKTIIFFNSNNKLKATPMDRLNSLNVSNSDEILIFQNDEYEKYRQEREREEYALRNKDQDLMHLVECQRANHQPNKIQFICKELKCDQYPASCSLCLQGIHNSHDKISDFIQLNLLKNMNFSLYSKFRFQLKEMETILSEQLQGLDKLVEQLNPNEKFTNFQLNPGYGNANSLGYAIRFFEQIPKLSKELNKMRINIEYQIEQVYRELLVGMEYKEIIQKIQPEAEYEYQFRKSQFVKNMSFTVDAIGPHYELKLGIECPQMAPVALIRTIITKRLIDTDTSKKLTADCLNQTPMIFYGKKNKKVGVNWEKICQIIEPENDEILVLSGKDDIEKLLKTYFEQY